MSDNPDNKLATNSEDSKGMGEGANHPFEATGREWWEAQNRIREQAPQAPSLFLNEPEGIQANRKQMQAYEREQEELRLLRAVYEEAKQVKEIGLGTWFGPFEELESACYDLEVFHNPNPSYSGAVGLPEAEGRLDE